MVVLIAQDSPPKSTTSTTHLTLEEYREIEATAEERHEYRDGEIVSMPGGSEAHSAIATNLLVYLGFLLRDTNFRLYNGDLRVWIPQHRCGTYPDLMVINGEPEFNGDSASAFAELRADEILNPLLIVEVFSPSTEAYDRGEKFRKYRSLSSLQEYLLVSQIEPYIEQYYNSDRSANNRWQWQACDRLEQSISLPSLNLELPMQEIYRRINF